MTVAGKKDKDITVAVAGSTGYIGKFVTMECVRRGYKTIALTRNPDAVVEGAEMVVADVTDPASIDAALAGRKVRGWAGCRSPVVGGGGGVSGGCYCGCCC